MWSASNNGWLYVETDMAHGTDIIWSEEASAKLIPGSSQPMLNCSFVDVININLGETFESFKVHELVIASSNRERQSLAHHRMVRLLAPHVQEAPLFFHMVYSGSQDARRLIDQMANVGFDMMIYSFGSDFDIESDNATYIEQIAADVAYANSRGIEVGGYDLISLTRSANVPTKWKAIDPVTQKPSNNACMASEWHDYLLEKMLTFIKKTNLSMIETDGPYGGTNRGFPCASQTHKHHHGLTDSVYQNTIMQGKMFTILRTKNIYINQPDTYFYQGGNRDGELLIIF